MAGSNSLQEMMTGGPAIILVEPQLGQNIGMVARAMANFGLSELRIVNPRDGWPSESAVSAAAKADHVIEAAQIYETLEEALHDVHFCYATTARNRDGFKPVREPVEASKVLRSRQAAGQTVAILFGRERIGLRNNEVALADEIVTFPVNPAFASLNIAQAVLLMSYEWLRSGMEGDVPRFEGPVQEQATKEELFGLFEQVENALEPRGYFRTEERKPRMVDNLRAVLTRPEFSKEEIRVLRGVFRSLVEFTPEKPKARKDNG